MRIFHIEPGHIRESADLEALSAQGLEQQGYVWIACGRPEFEAEQMRVQAALQALCGVQLVDLHISDLINKQLPSHYDYTSQYDVLVFRRLAASSTAKPGAAPVSGAPAGRLSGPPILRRIDTSPVGFAVFDRVLLTVHPDDCTVRDTYADKLLQTASATPGLCWRTWSRKRLPGPLHRSKSSPTLHTPSKPLGSETSARACPHNCTMSSA